MSEIGYTVPALPEVAFPPFAVTSKERERWQLAHAIATEISRQHELTGRPNSTFVFFFARHVYASPLPTGAPEDRVLGRRDQPTKPRRSLDP